MARSKVLHRFYCSIAWITLRLVLINERIARDGKLLCDRCRNDIRKPEEAIGHHKIELTEENVNDANISLNPEEIEIICFDCHNIEHNRFGYIADKNVYLVYGPPMSGKSSYVKRHMQRGDIVIDMDKLYAAVSLLPSYDKPDNLFRNVIGIHSQLIDNIKTRYGKWNNAWIIGGYADKYKRERIINETGAEVIFLDISKEECLSRLVVDEERQHRREEWAGYIEKWYENYVF